MQPRLRLRRGAISRTLRCLAFPYSGHCWPTRRATSSFQQLLCHCGHSEQLRRSSPANSQTCLSLQLLVGTEILAGCSGATDRTPL